jgi:trehalose-6-phosphatase
MLICMSSLKNAKVLWKGAGLDYRILVTNEKYRELDIQEIAKAFKMSKNILILLGLDGTLVPKNSQIVVMNNEGDMVKVVQEPKKHLIQDLEYICNDKRCNLFIITSRDMMDLEYWFNDYDAIGLVAEDGFLFRMPREEHI